MKEKIKKLAKDKFLKNVSTLAAGSIISQVIVIAFSPLLSRLFTIEAFGNLSIFTSVTVFFAVLSTGRYEQAIGLPDDDEKALKIFKVIIFIGGFVSSIYFFLIIFLREILQINDGVGFLSQQESYIAPIYVFFIAVYSALGYWNQRLKKYKLISISNAIQVILTTLLNVFFGILGFDTGMIWSLLGGIIGSTLFLIVLDFKFIPLVLRQKKIYTTAMEYSKFPRYMILSDLLLVAHQYLLPILFALLYNATIVGLFAMANRMLRIPNIILTSSIANVFRNEAIDEIRKEGNCSNLYIKTFKKLILISVPIYSVLFLTAPFLFKFFLGDKWYTAGIYARIISLFLMFEFISVPLTTIFNVRDKQNILMKIQCLNTCTGIVMLFIGHYLFNNSLTSLVFYTSNSILYSIIFITVSYRLSLNTIKI